MRTIPALAALVLGPSLSAALSVDHQPFGLAGGKPVEVYTLRDGKGCEARIMTYGATVTELKVPDRKGVAADVVLGFPSVDGYLGKEPYFGAIVGRVGNRIAQGRFSIGNRTYQLACNDGPNHLHGGVRGFDKVVWSARTVSLGGEPAVEFTYVSPDGEEGYPGTCTVSVTYQLRDGVLALHYQVSTDKDTPVNVTNHSYFNLGGAEKGGIVGDLLTLYASGYTPVDAHLIPTGQIAPVAGTPFDFRKPTAIGLRIKEVGGEPVGYDHNFVIDPAMTAGGGPATQSDEGALLHVATVANEASGRTMEVWSTEPGVQFYSGNFLDGTIVGKAGVRYQQYHALCLETQHFPDSVNHPNFPSYVLAAGKTYRSATFYVFAAH